MGKSPIFAIALALAAAALGSPLDAAPKVIAVSVDGMVHPITTEIVASALALAKRERASLVLIRLNTPGGLMEAMRETMQQIVSSSVPVATYVTPSGGRAASAGFFLLESGDVAAMAPGTNTGAAHPVALGVQMDAVMKEKVENDAAASLRSITTKRARNAELAETAVRQSKSFTEREALDQHLIDLVVSSERELLAAIDGREIARFDSRRETLHTAGAEIVEYQRTARQRIIASVADPNIALILLVIGALLIYVEFSMPGLIAPGVIGSILLLVGLSAISALPINWLGAALLLLAVALFVLEAKIVSHGVLGAGGAVAMVLGAVLLIDSPFPEMRIRWGTAIALALPFSAITVLLVSLALRARRNKVETGAEGMIGVTGAAITDLKPEGKVFVHGEYWNAVSSRPLQAGSRIRVTNIDKLKLTVESEAEK